MNLIVTAALVGLLFTREVVVSARAENQSLPAWLRWLNLAILVLLVLFSLLVLNELWAMLR